MTASDKTAHGAQGVMQRELEMCRSMVEQRLHTCFSGAGGSYQTLLDSMRYSLLAGGKRIRPVLCLKFCEAAGGDQLSALDAACAIEMLHTYSLIHDDLPCMDDDDLRRGKPSNHVKFGVTTATLAGDALQAAAFETLMDSQLPPGSIVEIAHILAHAAGAHGICGGQYLDIAGEGAKLTLAELSDIHMLKTASMISASARIGVVAAGGAPGQIEAADRYAEAIGIAFQVRDDILDNTATAEEMGKPAGSDKKSNKTTFATLMGAEQCERMIANETEKAIAALRGHFAKTDFLVWLAQILAKRKY